MENATLFGKLHARCHPFGTAEKSKAHFLFHTFDSGRKRWLGNIERLCRVGVAEHFGQTVEIAQMVKLHVAIPVEKAMKPDT